MHAKWIKKSLCLLLCLGLATVAMAQGDTLSVLDRVQNVDNPELGELIRVALENQAKLDKSDRTEPLEIMRKVTVSYVQIKLFDQQIAEVSRKIVTLLGESTKPVLAATRGDVRDLGLGFFLAADIRLASTKAAFTCQNLTTGLIAGWGLTHTLPQLIGPGRSLDFLWSHRTIGGDEAARIGLVDRLFDDAVWEQELDTYIQQLVQLPQPAVHLTKLAVDQAATMDYTTMLSVEWESQQQCWASLETSEGLAAWRENRPPVLAVSIEDEEE